MLFPSRFGIAATTVLSLAGTSLALNVTVASRPWLDVSLPTEERLSLLMMQWNKTQIYAQVQGDTVVSTHSSQVLNDMLMISSLKTTELGSQHALDTSVATTRLEYQLYVWVTVQQELVTL